MNFIMNINDLYVGDSSPCHKQKSHVLLKLDVPLPHLVLSFLFLLQGRMLYTGSCLSQYNPERKQMLF